MLRTLGVVLAIGVVSTIGYIGLHTMGVIGNVVTMPGQVINQELTPQKVIANYEWFKQQYQDIQAVERKISIQKASIEQFTTSAGPRDKWTFEDKNEEARLRSILFGLNGSRESMVAEYNARTQMLNRDLFRTSDLPAYIEP